MISPEARAQSLKEEALRLGASRVGICRSTGLPHGDVLMSWLEQGLHGTMGYMARAPECRCDPRASFPGARSCIVIAVDHQREPPPALGLPGGVARYAAGRDYHDVLNRILEGLSARVGELGGHARAYVDTGPLLERELAMAAGLGFIGKNTMLIAIRAGSYHLLGEILTDLDLAPDRPSVPHCGTCTRCLDLCPTGAFPGPYVLDARRCISYLTIEHRGALPRSAVSTGDHVFGCDICQEVCPWNRKAHGHQSHPELLGSGEEPPTFSDLLALDDAAFRDRYRRTALWRSKRRGLLRNVALALSRSGGLAAIGPLRSALRDPDSLVRRHAARALAGVLDRRRRGRPGVQG